MPPIFLKATLSKKNSRRDWFCMGFQFTRAHMTTLASQEKNSRSQSGRSFRGFGPLLGGSDAVRWQLSFAGSMLEVRFLLGGHQDCSSLHRLKFKYALMSLKRHFPEHQYSHAKWFALCFALPV